MDAIAREPRSLTGNDPAPSLIAATDLRFSVAGAAGPVNILRGLDLRIGAGEAVGLVGPSGSGKTSLLMLLAGLEKPTGGTLRVAGHHLRRPLERVSVCRVLDEDPTRLIGTIHGGLNHETNDYYSRACRCGCYGLCEHLERDDAADPERPQGSGSVKYIPSLLAGWWLAWGRRRGVQELALELRPVRSRRLPWPARLTGAADTGAVIPAMLMRRLMTMRRHMAMRRRLLRLRTGLWIRTRLPMGLITPTPMEPDT